MKIKVYAVQLKQWQAFEQQTTGYYIYYKMWTLLVNKYAPAIITET